MVLSGVQVIIRGGYGTVGKTAVRAIARGLRQNVQPWGVNMSREQVLSAAMFGIVGHRAKIGEAADLIRKDSTHGFFEGDVEVRGNHIVLNGVPFEYQQTGLDQIQWAPNALRVMIDAVGDIKEVNKKDPAKPKDDAAKVLRNLGNPNGADIFINTTTFKGQQNYIVGLNDERVDNLVARVAAGEDIGHAAAFGTGSCTTNASLPLLSVLASFMTDAELADLTTVHSFTGSQALIDGPSAKAPERGRAAAQNMLLTSTNASELAKVWPGAFADVDGAIAVRGPWSEGSIVKLLMEGKQTGGQPLTAQLINEIYREAAASGRLKGILGYVPEGDIRASSDFVTNAASSTFDANYTTAKMLLRFGPEWARVKLHGWYANAYAVPHRAVELMWRAVNVVGNHGSVDV